MPTSKEVEEVTVDPVEEIVKYVMHTPGNTNPAVLRSMLQSLTATITSASEDDGKA